MSPFSLHLLRRFSNSSSLNQPLLNGRALSRLQAVAGHVWPHTDDASQNNDGHDEKTGKKAGGVAAAVAASSLVFASTAMAHQQRKFSAAVDATPKSALSPQEFRKFRVKEISKVSHNTKIFRFEIEPEAILGLHVASCLLTKAAINGENVIRPYTPISQPETTGHFDLLIKVYGNGKMTQHFDKLKPGDEVEMKGPVPKLSYTPNMKKSIGMVAGGSGITPMLQVVDAIINNPEDNTHVSLIFANTSPQDVLLKPELDARAATHPNFNVFYLIDKAAEGWQGGVGYVTKDVICKALPPPSPDSLILVCGPPGMMRVVSGDKAPDKSQGEVEGVLKELGYNKDHVYKF